MQRMRSGLERIEKFSYSLQSLHCKCRTLSYFWFIIELMFIYFIILSFSFCTSWFNCNSAFFSQIIKSFFSQNKFAVIFQEKLLSFLNSFSFSSYVCCLNSSLINGWENINRSEILSNSLFIGIHSLLLISFTNLFKSKR